ncbi:hypothetical protein KUTeg_018787 [Tegillarca granosa]|uniref:Uncharacterized protein n=1 Tax=Tegillarca granosa TaxID=220873 RepID=A0ABQ9EIC2_TEGGR|nr:hypothetical protein KUTeg_018787 [Tegillarca granosa]
MACLSRRTSNENEDSLSAKPTTDKHHIAMITPPTRTRVYSEPQKKRHGALIDASNSMYNMYAAFCAVHIDHGMIAYKLIYGRTYQEKHVDFL